MRLPVIPSLSTKDGSANKNARLTNMLRERNKAQVRPGLSPVLDYAGDGQGLVPFNGRLITLFGDTVYNDNGAAFDLTTATGSASPLGYLAWNSGYTYPLGAWVTYSGVSYVSMVNGNTGVTPGTSPSWLPYSSGSSYTLVSGSAEGIFGYASGSLGSLTPSTFSGSNITGFYSTSNTFFVLAGSHAQSVFTSLTANGITLGSASADVFTDSGTDTTWEWYSTSVFADTSTYPVTIA